MGQYVKKFKMYIFAVPSFQPQKIILQKILEKIKNINKHV